MSAPPDIQEIMRLHLDGSRRRDQLLAECQRLRDAGKVAEAKRALAKAEEIEARLREMEAALNPRDPSST